MSNHNGKIVVKVMSKAASARLLACEWRGKIVFTTDPACATYDWLLVYDELPVRDEGTFRNGREPLACPRANTILATWEPPTIKNYSSAYVRQFGHLLTNLPREAFRHLPFCEPREPFPRIYPARGYYRWLTERSWRENSLWQPPEKTRLISAVCSAKAMKWTKHHARIALLRRLTAEIPEAEWYGHDVREFDRKCDVMDTYKYHVAIENYIAPHYWSEKIADAFLCGCLPFYAGAPDLARDFPPESFIPIPIDDPAESVSIIKAAIAAGEYEKRRDAIEEARRLILEKYNFWDEVAALIASAPAANQNAPTGSATHAQTTRQGEIVARKVLRRSHPSAVAEDFIFHMKQYLGGLI